MGVLRRFLTGDVIEPDELARHTADGVLLHARKLPARVELTDFRAPGRASSQRVLRSSGGVLVTGTRFVMWAMGDRQLDLAREKLPSEQLAVTVDDDSVGFDFRAEDFHQDRSGRVQVRLRTDDARAIQEWATSS
jgi:hypothetical protein